MLTVEEAQRIARDAFPDGPERLAEILGVVVQIRPLGGCDGICLSRNEEAVIFLSEAHATSRRRFTLAHELGHLLLGIPPTAGESLADILTSDSDEEKRVNALASELLLPQEIVEQTIREIPVVAADLKKLAKLAQVSELSTALRVADLATALRLNEASVVHFDGAGVKWQYSRSNKISADHAHILLQETRKADHGVYRVDQGNGTIAVASTIENSFFDSTTLFVQVLSGDTGNIITSYERRKDLESLLLADHPKLAAAMTGYIGALKNRIVGKSPSEVEQDFWTRYRDTLADTPLNSEAGREYVRIRIQQWY